MSVIRRSALQFSRSGQWPIPTYFQLIAASVRFHLSGR